MTASHHLTDLDQLEPFPWVQKNQKLQIMYTGTTKEIHQCVIVNLKKTRVCCINLSVPSDKTRLVEVISVRRIHGFTDLKVQVYSYKSTMIYILTSKY